MISQQMPTPRLLMEVNYRDPVPKLVSIYETATSRNNTLFEQKLPRSQAKEIVLDQQIGDLKKALASQRDENEELKSLIKELTIKTEKLREVNEALISRIKEVELSYRALRAELEKQNIDQKRKLKVMIYRDLQEYVKASVANFTEALKIEKMTPRLENKVETFLAELMHINSVSVDNFGKKERMQQMNIDNNELAKQINTFVENQAKSQRSNSPMVGFPTRIQYNTVLSKLSHIQAKSMALGQSVYRGSLSKERDDRRHTPSKVGNLRDVYATTPNRRRRIFE